MTAAYMTRIGKARALGAAVATAAALLFTSCGKAEDLFANRPCSGRTGVRDRRFDASAYDALVKRYVNDRGLVDYRTWKEMDASALDAYLDDAGCVDPAALKDDDERLAFWINLYNAVTIKGILHFYPTKSIKDHVSHVFGFNIWKDYYCHSAGKKVSLDDIENQILRKMGEPRIHFAIVCASIGCPKLRSEAYVGPRVREQLQDQGKTFFRDASKFRIETDKGRVFLSPIFDWFGGDFGENESARLKFVARFVEEPAAKARLEKGDLKIKFLDYDWSLNEQRK